MKHNPPWSILLLSNLVKRKINLRRFNFRLQSILNLKEKKLEDERLKLAGIISVLESQKDILLEMNEKKEYLEAQLENITNSQVLDIQNVVGYKNFLNQTAQDIKMQFEIIKKTQFELEEQQIKVNEAYREVKVLEKLKEKQYKNFLFEYEQTQIKEIDDITISRQRKAI